MSPIQNFLSELKRRNVVRAGAAYVVLAWLVIQVADILFETFAAPIWLMQGLVIALAAGLPVTLVGAWVYELTREGLKRTVEVDFAESITNQTRRKLDFVIVGVLITAVAIFAVDKFVLQPGNAERNYTAAVMPFEIISADVAPFFAQLSGDLARLLKRSSQMRLASTDAVDALPDIRDAVASSARLGVRYLISGSISSSVGSVGLKVSVFDSDSGKQVWQRDFENAHSQATLNSVATELITAIDGDPFALPKVASDPKAYELYLQARRQSTSSDAGAAAGNLFRRALELDPRFAPALAGLCDLLVSRYSKKSALADFEEAEKYCHRAWTIDPYSAEVQRAIGNLYFESGQPDRAREAFASALAISPGELLTQVDMATTWHEDDPARAEQQLLHIIDQHPGSPFAYGSLQYLYFKQGRYPEAITYAQAEADLIPEDRRAMSNLTGNMVMAGRFAEARPLLEKAVERNSLMFGVDHNNLATVLFFEGDFERAEELYQRAVTTAPENAFYYRNLGDAVFYNRGREAAATVFTSAIDLAKKQLAINPENYDAPSVLLVSYASIGDRESFAKWEEGFLATGPDDPQVLYDLAVATSRLGDMETSRAYAREAVDAGYPVAFLN
ncbi:MAG: tetratricopeptide repeat protein, partial [Gammaproteobacteria bacterium]|nr:tetratricopeptide repeat protein [Gammaproteobacteria bacterium]